MRSPLFVRLYGRGRFRSLLSTCLLLILVVICPLANASSDEIAFDVSGSFRVRYESLNNPIFPTSSAAREQSNQRLSTRFIVNSTVSYQNLAATIEIRDSRVFLDENDPTLTANQVNSSMGKTSILPSISACKLSLSVALSTTLLLLLM